MNDKPTRASKGRIRIMSFNIRHARGMDGMVNVERIAEVIAGLEPDLVGLQEVDRGVARTDRRDLPAELARLTAMTPLFERNIVWQGGDYGNAILSRLPVLRSRHNLLPRAASVERQGALQAVVQAHGEEILFLNTHLDFAPEETDRLIGVEEIVRIVHDYGGLPAILCGDFNAPPGSASHERMKEHFLDVWEAIGDGPGCSFPSDSPDRRIDYLWLSREGKLVPRRVWLHHSLASDHLPLLTDLEIMG
jgi:endonuclease/exonuclease/phosphatase family metal-dependent hydrolase